MVKLALEHVFLRVLLYFLVTIIPPILHTPANLNYALVRRAGGRKRCLSFITEHWREEYFMFLGFILLLF